MKLPTISERVKRIDHQKAARLVREARKKKKLSLRDVAKQLGFSAAYLSDLERGRRNWSSDLFDKVNAVLQ